MKLPGRIWAIVLISVCIKAYFGMGLLLDIPSVSPDEAIYFDLVQNFYESGQFYSKLWEGMIPGIEKAALWNPPSYFLTLAAWGLIQPLTIITMRYLSLILGIVSMVSGLLYIALTQKIGMRMKELVVASTAAAFLVEYFFQRASHVARPEMFIISTIMLALLVLKKSSNYKDLIVSGLLCSLAVLAHPIALVLVMGVFYKIAQDMKFTYQPRILYFVIALGALPLLWLVSILPNWDLLQQQLTLAAQRKQLEEGFLLLATRTNVESLKWSFSAIQLASLVLLYKSFTSYNLKKLPVMIVMMSLSWVIFLTGRMMWYGIFAMFFFILASAELALTLKTTKKIGRVLCALWSVALVTMAINTYQQITISGTFSDYYWEYTHALEQVISPEATVFLSAEPDPYFGLKETQKQLNLVEFPVLEMPLEEYEAILDTSDYVIMTGTLNRVVFGNFLDEYLQKNTLYTYNPNEFNYGYQAYVLELVPRQERTSVLPD